MSIVSIFLQAFLSGLSGAMMPGSLLTYNIQLSYKKGFWVGPKLMIGHAILEGLLIIGLSLGLGAFIQLPVTKVILWLVGGIMLLLMGYELVWLESKKNVISTVEVAATGDAAVSKGATNMNPVFAGALISLMNPYWSLWWATIGLVLITQAMNQGWVMVVIFYLGHITADFGWYSLVSMAVSKGRQFISGQFYRWLLIVCGIFLIFLAIMFFYDALRTIGISGWFFEKTIDLFKHSTKAV